MLDKTQLEGMVEGLTAVRDEFIKNKEELKYSIRKDVVSLQLKSILNDCDNYNELRAQIEKLIAELLTI